FASIVAPEGAQVSYRGELVPDSERLDRQLITIDGVRWESFSLALDPGVHQLEAEEAFGLIVYAYDDYVSYAFPGGLDLTPRTKE
ncbi:unnamed protein product, partial [Laminaria digitata]